MEKKPQKIYPLKTVSLSLTQSIGTPTSVAIHTFLFVGIFVLYFFGVEIDKILLILTTAVSLEAIYLSIFIQMSINRNTQSLQEVEKDVDEIQEDVDEIQEDVDEIQKDVDEIQEDVDEIQADDQNDLKVTHEVIKTKELIISIEGRLQEIAKELQLLKKEDQKSS